MLKFKPSGVNKIPSFVSEVVGSRAKELNNLLLPYYCMNCQRLLETFYLTDNFGPLCKNCIEELERDGVYEIVSSDKY